MSEEFVRVLLFASIIVNIGLGLQVWGLGVRLKLCAEHAERMRRMRYGGPKDPFEL